MQVPENLRSKPMEVLAAATLIVGGILLAAMATKVWCQIAGSAMAAVGGALLSYTASDINVRRKAVNHLKPELQFASRHLADTVTKLSRNVQAYEYGSLDSDVAIDRIAQLTSSLYGTVNDLQILVGAPPDLQGLVDTVRSCEEMATRLRQLAPQQGERTDDTQEEVDQLRMQLESARMQLASAQREFGDVEVAKVNEEAQCPNCGRRATVKLGRNPGDSAMSWCSECGDRFHIHRDNRGDVFTRPWGGGPANTKHMEVKCAACSAIVPLNFHIGRSHEDRFCMACGSLLKITDGAAVEKIVTAAPLRAAIVRWTADRAILECPDCRGQSVSIWRKDNITRAVCRTCNKLLESDVSGPIEEGKMAEA